MKKAVIAFCLVLFSGSLAEQLYIRTCYEEPWLADFSDKNSYTCQFWSAKNVDGFEPVEPLTADNRFSFNDTDNIYYNPYGCPTATWSADWLDDPNLTANPAEHPFWARGCFVSNATTEPNEVTVNIPVGGDFGKLKVIVQYDWYSGGQVIVAVKNAAGDVTANDVTPTTDGYGNIQIWQNSSADGWWYRTTKVFEFNHNPAEVKVVLTLNGPNPIVDSFSITTAIDASLDFTFQKWDFGNGDYNDVDAPGFQQGDPALPLTADGGSFNQYGTPKQLSITYGNPDYMFWLWSFDDDGGYMQFEGALRRAVFGGMTGFSTDYGWFSTIFKIPNVENVNKKNLILVNLDYLADKNDGDQVTVELASDENFAYPLDMNETYSFEQVLPYGVFSSVDWYNYRGIYKSKEHPNFIYARITVGIGEDEEALVVAMDNISFEVRSLQLGDIDSNGVVNLTDYAEFAKQWSGVGVGLSADLDDSGKVDFEDMRMFCDGWLK